MPTLRLRFEIDRITRQQEAMAKAESANAAKAASLTDAKRQENKGTADAAKAK